MAYTIEQVQDAALIAGVPKDKAEHFYHHYNAQGWLRGNGLPITNLASMLVLWKLSKYRFDQDKGPVKQLREMVCKICGGPANMVHGNVALCHRDECRKKVRGY